MFRAGFLSVALSTFVCVIGLDGSAAARAQSVLYVNAGAIGDGSSWCEAYAHLQDALATAAASGGAVTEIRVAQGVYRPDRGTQQTAGNRSATFRLVDGVVLTGGYAGCDADNPDERHVTLFETILSGDLLGNDGDRFANRSDNSLHVVTYDDPNATGVVLDGFSIVAGNADGPSPANQGAGIHIRNGTIKCIPGGPTIRNCTIRDNWASHHGAVNDHGLGTVIEDCTFSDNQAGEEGAGLLIHSGPTRVTGCTFTNNFTPMRGGGVWIGHDSDPSCVSTGDPSFINCSFSGNRANYAEGSNEDGGAAIYNEGGPLNLDNCTFTDNVAFAWAGGVYLQAGSGATITNCTFVGNRADQPAAVQSYGNGGAIAHRGPGHLTIAGCSLLGNHATNGGALSNFGPATIVDSVFDGNIGESAGGAIRNWRDMTITRCTFNNQVASLAGAIYCEAIGVVKLTNCAFTGNRATHVRGGAIMNLASSNMTATNCLFADNQAFGLGGAIYNSATLNLANCTIVGNQSIWSDQGAVVITSPAAASIANSIIWGNLSPTNQTREIDQVYVQGGSLTVDYSCVQNWSGILGGVANMGNDPLFTNLSATNFRLSTGSPCINTAAETEVPPDVVDLDADGNMIEPTPLDLDEFVRVAQSSVDRGAYEYGLCPPGFISVDGQQPCQPCPPGTHQANPGATLCVACGAGTFQPLSESTECITCAPGTFQSEAGSISCDNCIPGTYQPEAGQTSCQACAPGTAQPVAGAAACIACGGLTYQPASGQTTCLTCACDDQDGCTVDSCDSESGSCQSQAIDGCSIPAASEWGLMIMTLLVMTTGPILLPGRA